MNPAWLYLAVAIVSEVIGTSFLKASDGFTRFGPAVATIAFYLVAFYFLALTLKTIPVGIAYAIWAGVGVALIALVGWLVFRQPLDAAGVLGISLIVAGVLVLHLFSSSLPEG